MKVEVLHVVLSFLFPAVLMAAPQISSVSGNFWQGAQISITGSEFLSWSQSDVLAWDDFEVDSSGNYTAGDEIPTSPKVGTWHKFDTSDNSWTISALIDSSCSISGSQSMWGHRGLRDWSGASVYFDMLQNLYVSFWFRYNHGTGGQVKLMQVKGTELGSCPDYEPQVSTGDASAEWWKSYIALDEPHGCYAGGCQVTDPYNSSYATLPAPDTWHYFEAILRQSDPDTANGAVEIRINGEPQFNVSNVLTRVLPQSRWTLVQMINGMTNYDTSNTWVDDMYVSRSFSRVLLCNAATYQSSAKCFIQLPAFWSGGQIVFTANVGTIAEGQQAYLYVVNSAGAVTQSGRQVTIQAPGGGDSLSPAAPGSLRVQP